MFEELCAIAYKKERTLGRRLAKNANMPEEDALKQTLEKVAGNRPLAELISERRSFQLKAAESLAARRRRQTDERNNKATGAQPNPTAWLAWFDGATRPNPGKMGIGGYLKNPNGERTEISFSAGHGDSNEAEYLALIAVLKEALRFQPQLLHIYGDSRVVVDQMTGVTRIVAANLQIYIEQAKQLVSRFQSVSISWIPRKKNYEADALSQRALLD